MKRLVCNLVITTSLLLASCTVPPAKTNDTSLVHTGQAIYEVQVKEGLSYQDVIDSLKSLSEGENYVNPANFPIHEQMKKRDIDSQGVKEVRTYCNLAQGADIILDHPEFLVYAPCRIAIYEKLDVNHQRKLFLALARPTHDLQNIKNPTPRALKAAQTLEDTLIRILNKASRGDI